MEMSPRVCWVLIDGVGDVGSETPLQVCPGPPFALAVLPFSAALLTSLSAAQKQSMDACDAVASAGVSGLMDPVQAGHCPELNFPCAPGSWFSIYTWTSSRWQIHLFIPALWKKGTACPVLKLMRFWHGRAGLRQRYSTPLNVRI